MADSQHKMKILLTGGTGFIGKALLPALLRSGHTVTLLARRNTGQKLGIEEIIAETASWPDAVKGRKFDLCINLAWIATPGIYLSSPENDLFAEMTPRLADSLFQYGLPHFFGLGTCIEYAPHQQRLCIPGETIIAPETAYGKAKESARKGLSKSAKTHGRGYTWGRLFYPYGKGEHHARIPSSFLQTLRQDSALDLKTPDSVKDWIEIRDIVSAILCVSSNAQPLGEINIGTGKGIDIKTLAEKAAEITGRSPSLISCSSPPNQDPYPFHVAGIDALEQLGWKPKISLEEGLRDLSHNLNNIL